MFKNSKSGKKPVGIFDGSWCNCHTIHRTTGDYDSTNKNSMISDVNTSNINPRSQHYREFKLELDSHANVTVMGKGDHVEYTGRTVDDNAFSPQYDTSQIPIVDTVMQYDCTHSGKSYLLYICNALYVPEMNNHLFSHHL